MNRVFKTKWSVAHQEYVVTDEKHTTVGVSYTGAWGSDVDSHGIMGNLRINF